MSHLKSKTILLSFKSDLLLLYAALLYAALYAALLHVVS